MIAETPAETSPRATVGFVGLGDIGIPMMSCLVNAGFDTVAYDLRPVAVAAAQGLGARPARDLSDLATASSVVCIAVVNGPQLAVVIDEVGPALKPGSCVIVHSSVHPSEAIAAAERLSVSGIDLLDAPVSGRSYGATNRSLTIMVGGSIDLFKQHQTLLESYGVPTHLGPVGAGQVTKLADNALVNGQMLVALEVLRLAAAYGIDEVLCRQVISQSTGACYVLDHWDDLMGSFFLTHTAAGTPELIDCVGKEPRAAVVASHNAGFHSPILALLAEALHPMLTERMELVRAGASIKQAVPAS